MLTGADRSWQNQGGRFAVLELDARLSSRLGFGPHRRARLRRRATHLWAWPPSLVRPCAAATVSRPGRPGESERTAAGAAEFDVARTPVSVALVRRYCVDACSRLGWADSADAVELLVSELATNAVLHACGPRMRVRVLDRGLRLRVEVSDDSLTLPVPRRAAAQAESGRGMALVETLAVDAGCDVTVHGKTAWFEVGL